jgi:hypothetical protein
MERRFSIIHAQYHAADGIKWLLTALIQHKNIWPDITLAIAVPLDKRKILGSHHKLRGPEADYNDCTHG